MITKNSLPKGMSHQYEVIKIWPGGPAIGSKFTYVLALNVYMCGNLPMEPSVILSLSTYFNSVKEANRILLYDGSQIHIGDYYYVVINNLLVHHASGYNFKVGAKTMPAVKGELFFGNIADALKYLVYYTPLISIADTMDIKPDLSIPLKMLPMDFLAAVLEKNNISIEEAKKIMREEK